MVVIRLFKKNQNFFYVNLVYKKTSIKGKIIKRIGFCNNKINFKKKFFLNYKLLFFYINKGVKMSKRFFEMLSL